MINEVSGDGVGLRCAVFAVFQPGYCLAHIYSEFYFNIGNCLFFLQLLFVYDWTKKKKPPVAGLKKLNDACNERERETMQMERERIFIRTGFVAIMDVLRSSVA